MDTARMENQEEPVPAQSAVRAAADMGPFNQPMPSSTEAHSADDMDPHSASAHPLVGSVSAAPLWSATRDKATKNKGPQATDETMEDFSGTAVVTLSDAAAASHLEAEFAGLN